MEFSVSSEQQMIIDTVKAFVEQELYPHEAEVERTGVVSDEIHEKIKQAALDCGLYAANMPEELGGGGLDAVTLTLLEKELGRASFALQYIVARPSNILLACEGEQREKYLLPAIRGEKVDCLALTEPDAGSDVRSMKCRAERTVIISSLMAASISSVMRMSLTSSFCLPLPVWKIRHGGRRRKLPASWWIWVHRASPLSRVTTVSLTGVTRTVF